MRSRTFLCHLTATVLLLTPFTPTHNLYADETPSPSPDTRSLASPAVEQRLIELTNQERHKEGLPELALSPRLLRAARGHSANMAKQEKLSHTLDEKGVGERLSDVEYRWSYCAENIAQGAETPEEAMELWMNSPPHRANLLSTECREMGAAVASSPSGETYWTMVMAKPQ